MTATKHPKLRRALKLPFNGRGGTTAVARNTFVPRQGEQPIVFLRVQVLSGNKLLAKDRNGFSDPFVVASLLQTRHHTPVAKKTVNPVYAPKDATWDFPIYLSLAEKLGVVELVVWDKDVLRKDYLGEAGLAVEDWFADARPKAWDAPGNVPFTLPLVSTRPNTPSQGTIQLRVGFVLPRAPTAQNQAEMDLDALYSNLVKNTRKSLVSAPPTEGVGTIRSHIGPAFAEFEDDGGLSSASDECSDNEEGEGDSEEEDDGSEYHVIPGSPASEVGVGGTGSKTPTGPSPLTTPTPSSSGGIVSAVPLGSTLASSAATIVPSASAGAVGGEKEKKGKPSFIALPLPKKFLSRSRPTTPGEGKDAMKEQQQQQKESAGNGNGKKRFRRSWSGAGTTASTGNDIVGIVMLEIASAVDLPRLKNMTRTSFDMDPFVVISFGKKVFRTRVIRHSLNPVWDEKLLFHVRRYEIGYEVRLTVLDWDKLSSNDYIGEASFNVSELDAAAAERGTRIPLYAETEGGDHPMKEFKLKLETGAAGGREPVIWESKHSPVLSFRAKYQPYSLLRQRFWRQYLKQYDTDDTKTLSHIEITSMLDSLGSTLTADTIDSFFTRFGKDPQHDDLTVEEAIRCLETEVLRPESERRRVDEESSGAGTGLPSTSASPAPERGLGGELRLGEMDFAGPALDVDFITGERKGYVTEPSEMVLLTPGQATPGTHPHSRHPTSESSSDADLEEDSSGSSEESFERVINVKNCPLCHRPRLNSKAEVDIITHIAVCASQDWNIVDRIVVGNFVTASQAQRKWYTKIIGKISSGDYRLGANSANIIVQNRLTGQLEEEKMQVYVRLGIRLLYKGMKSRMEGGRARRLLKSLSIKQGVKYDSPESARDIPTFIEFHQLKVEDILEPLSSFKTFNQFFYRKLKPSARPTEHPEDPYRLVSAADCRLMAFESVTEATRLWIKGREFTVGRLLGDAYKHEAERYSGGALAIFRLAPQDYHRFHSPVDGTIGNMTYIAGEYYTVNPQAIRTALDVYGENARKIVPIDSPQFGRVMAVCVGAMMVGSIETTVKEGETVKRGQEFGYFAFGGSTIVLLFEKDVVEWDEDLLVNGKASLETLVQVGMGIGNGTRKPGR
ncbi:phosphatidylserine decarboxylase-domain-containing protein [Mycena alexandri]|uniref:Phosphatidylserine decarboxylase proenzyme 2 n=1 Tax=Mycena alexandri TaxID=1745969 RepID=A0AAD6RYB3_9AGAR|nr:phosphatidylserine decarboxylase-domain-containing protein [Mycena alexandri]